MTIERFTGYACAENKVL